MAVVSILGGGKVTGFLEWFQISSDFKHSNESVSVHIRSINTGDNGR